MSDIITWSLPVDFRNRIKAILPKVTEGDFVQLAKAAAADALILDDDTFHPFLIGWVENILRRGMGDAGAMSVPPTPVKPAPAGAFMGVLT